MAERVSFSEISSFRRCQKAWQYRYVDRIKRKRKGVRLLKGSILHDMLDVYIKAKMEKGYDGDDPWDVLDRYGEEYATYFEEEREEYGDIIGDCGSIFEGYLRKWRRDPLKYTHSETPVELDLGELSNGALPIKFLGIIDKIATDSKGRRWIMDHKFLKSIPTADDRFSELQLLIYYWAWNTQYPDDEVDGVCWDYARSKAPTIPKLLKSGELSQAKNIDCDAYTYLKTIREHRLDEKKYVDMLDLLMGKEDTFFERVFVAAPSAAMTGEVVNDFLETTREIQFKRRGNRCARSMSSFNCNTCEFRSLCEAEVRGLDAEFVIKSEYTKREDDNGNKTQG